MGYDMAQIIHAYEVLKEKYELHFLRHDFIAVLGGFCLIVFVCCKEHISLYNLIVEKGDFLSAILTICSSLFGFLITSVTILISFLDHEKLYILKDTPQPRNMLMTFFSGIRVSALEMIIVLIAHFAMPIQKHLFYLIVFIFLVLIVRVMRILWIFYELSYFLLSSKK